MSLYLLGRNEDWKRRGKCGMEPRRLIEYRSRIAWHSSENAWNIKDKKNDGTISPSWPRPNVSPIMRLQDSIVELSCEKRGVTMPEEAENILLIWFWPLPGMKKKKKRKSRVASFSVSSLSRIWTKFVSSQIVRRSRFFVVINDDIIARIGHELKTWRLMDNWRIEINLSADEKNKNATCTFQVAKNGGRDCCDFGGCARPSSACPRERTTDFGSASHQFGA
jgi:hypothetical protein